MPTFDIDILALVSELENDTFFAEALLFPELSRYEESASEAIRNLRNSLPVFLDQLPTVEYHSRRAVTEVWLHKVEFELEPAHRSLAWPDPVPLVFHAACWESGGYHHGYFPALNLHVLHSSQEELVESFARNIQGELGRRGAARALENLIWYQRVKEVTTVRSWVSLNVTTPRRRVRDLLSEPAGPSVLKSVATLLDGSTLPPAFEMEEEVQRLADLLVGQHGRSVLLVGPSGVGKTALIYELVRRRRKLRLGSTPFWETTGARLMVGADSFGDWQERCRQVLLEASQNEAVLVLGNLFEFAEVARHATNPQGMAGFFRPYLERGDVLAIVEATPAQRDLLEKDHPHLLETFALLELKRPEPERLTSILLCAAGSDDRIEPEAIESIQRLHQRYAGYSAYPGRPLRFLAELMAEVQDTIGPAEVAAAFSEETGLPLFMVDDGQSMNLEDTKRFFQQRVLGQPEAVDLVVDLLAAVKAALSPPGRPIASLLFIGPTGVGKTEMARTLAQYLFQDRTRMVRFDMSEYADPMAVERLVGGRESGQGLLTDKVREQPFGVVLFDELEKADPAFFDLLLQILGEGRLTDGAGRLADFTNSLVVMTSNLGATSFSKGPLGFRSHKGEEAQRAREQFSSAVKAHFRPELFNRIDRLVPFAPLDRKTAAKVAERELQRLQRRDGIRHGRMTLEIGEGVAEYLAEVGYDRRYGARPLKRAIEQRLLGPLARAAAAAGDKEITALVTMKDQKLQVEPLFRSPSSQESSPLLAAAERALELRRRARKLLESRPFHDLSNKVHRLRRLRNRQQKRQFASDEEQARISRLPRFEDLSQRVEDALEEARELETEALLVFQGFQESEGALNEGLESQARVLDELVLDLYTVNFDEPDRATLLLYPEKGAELSTLLKAYRDYFEHNDIEYQPYRLSLGPAETRGEEEDEILRLGFGEESENRALWCRPETVSGCLAGEPLGIAMELQGRRILPLMLGESGLHVFGAAGPKSIEVVVWASPLTEYPPPTDLPVRRTLTGHKRRFYNAARNLVDDPHLERRFSWNGKALEQLIAQVLPAELARVAQEACQ